MAGALPEAVMCVRHLGQQIGRPATASGIRTFAPHEQATMVDTHSTFRQANSSIPLSNVS